MSGLSLSPAALLRLLGVMSALSVAIPFDLRFRRIPNAVPAALAVVALAAGALDDGWHGALLALAGGLVAALIFLLPVLWLGIGAGDLKLAAAIGMAGGPLFAVWSSLLAMAAGAVIAVAFLVQRAWEVARLRRTGREAEVAALPPIRRASIPYAVAIAAGTVATAVLEATS